MKKSIVEVIVKNLLACMVLLVTFAFAPGCVRLSQKASLDFHKFPRFNRSLFIGSWIRQDDDYEEFLHIAPQGKGVAIVAVDGIPISGSSEHGLTMSVVGFEGRLIKVGKLSVALIREIDLNTGKPKSGDEVFLPFKISTSRLTIFTLDNSKILDAARKGEFEGQVHGDKSWRTAPAVVVTNSKSFADWLSRNSDVVSSGNHYDFTRINK